MAEPCPCASPLGRGINLEPILFGRGGIYCGADTTRTPTRPGGWICPPLRAYGGGGAKRIPSRSAEGPLARTPLGWWPQAEAGTEQRRAKENDVIWTPGGRETTELAAEHLGTPDEAQCSGFPGSPRGAPGGVVCG